MSATDGQGAKEYLGVLGTSGLVPPGMGPAPFLSPGSYTIIGSGGADVGPFSASVTVPGSNPITWTNRDQLTTVDRTKPLTFTWTGTSSVVSLEGINYDVPTNTLDCVSLYRTGGATSFTVPS